MRRVGLVRATLVLAVAAALIPSAVAAETKASADRSDPPGIKGVSNVVGTPVPGPVREENDPQLTHQFDVVIHNVTGGEITYVGSDGERRQLGSVRRPATRALDTTPGFWASKYSRAVDGTASHVLAPSVYVVRMKAGPTEPYNPRNPEEWVAKLINLRPNKYHDAYHGRWSADVIYTDIPGGSAIFGGPSSPPVGSPLTYLDPETDRWRPLPKYYEGDYTKTVPQWLRYSVYRPVTQHGSPSYIEFENWAAGDEVAGRTMDDNGRILVRYPDGTEKHVADVVQRLAGSGRFGGTEYADIGQVTTNHPGALTLSTSPWVGFTWDPNVRGGVQIVPPNHVKYLSYNLGQNSFIDRPYWLIVGPIGASIEQLRDRRYIIDGRLSVDPGWEAVAPLFGMYIRTGFTGVGEEGSTYFEVSYDFGQTWQRSPNLTGVTSPPDSPVGDWTNIRIHLAYPGGESR